MMEDLVRKPNANKKDDKDKPKKIKISPVQQRRNLHREKWYLQQYNNDPTITYYSDDLIMSKYPEDLKFVYAYILNLYLKDALIGHPINLMAKVLEMETSKLYSLLLQLFSFDLVYITFTRSYDIRSVQILEWI